MAKKRIRLSNLRQARQFLSRLVNELYNGQIDGSKARDLGYLTKIFIDCYSQSELEARVEELEKITVVGSGYPLTNKTNNGQLDEVTQ